MGRMGAAAALALHAAAQVCMGVQGGVSSSEPRAARGTTPEHAAAYPLARINTQARVLHTTALGSDWRAKCLHDRSRFAHQRQLKWSGVGEISAGLGQTRPGRH